MCSIMRIEKDYGVRELLGVMAGATESVTIMRVPPPADEEDLRICASARAKERRVSHISDGASDRWCVDAEQVEDEPRDPFPAGEPGCELRVSDDRSQSSPQPLG